MVYLHSKEENSLIRHWANESKEITNEEATYYIRQVETDTLYYDAVDILPCRYSYEATNISIENMEVK